MKVRAHLDGQRIRGRRHRARKSRVGLLIGAAVFLAESPSTTTSVQAQSALPPVAVEAPVQRPKPTRASEQFPRRTRTAARQRNRDSAPAAAVPTLSERAAAAAAAQQAAKLGYRAMPSATTLRNGASP